MHGIPDFRQLNERLEALTGWRIVAVPGLVPDEVFFDHLANRRFPAATFIRRADQLDYLQEPDIFHDVFGHVPLLTNPVFADYMQAYGKGGLRALSARTPAESGAALLVHGRVRSDGDRRRAADLWRGHRLLEDRIDLRARIRARRTASASISSG